MLPALKIIIVFVGIALVIFVTFNELSNFLQNLIENANVAKKITCDFGTFF
jgi:galactitol-specific phosphotransferase system IIC component